MKKHKCEEFRYTSEKYDQKKNELGEVIGLGDIRYLVSWCSICGKKLRMVVAASKFDPPTHESKKE
jgi:hypothetical protein